MDQNNIKEELKGVLKKEGISWQKFSDLTEEPDRSNFRKKLLGWLENGDEALNTIGYKIKIVPIIKTEKEK